ncbi:5-(carboxyamino)imidazole ribonucleotide mutase [Desulfosporosinus sp. BICA1-9]|uniref:5-(carboxyamino)imidazole ribonucleotide mutase n=1 Tax=Desulfosporosinus sp. BICA1-9 TaxID=1531958 RepID=UPI00054C33A5|nr:5-(carboxyamino)imidazole ribonucleotide mutase [Desulfosporosinus sp. BICA1-9]KJS50226.1 MAG: N5-carboxyaminoimidazole ribonucleotide mutase [Peptococcaceae bacterium BRH_c23]KJS90155.1 MAG: N5-carboxyaminoimidazole ribonucleotide mutase [Desulfosporosinus sp. BICA1-9]HBW38925.1 5-(carboxyamino)imidazole ribonucleotide mutase [Desulfosporosinus sp.]
MSQIGVIMGSDSDYQVIEEALEVLQQFEVPFEVIISSPQRTLKRTVDWVKGFEAQGGKLIIAAAGLAAHLPGVVAGATTLPVIGVPMSSGAMEGIDALYSIVQMPPGIPVATVGIGAARNAALLAVQILASQDKPLSMKVKVYRAQMLQDIEAKDEALQKRLSEEI